MIEGSKLSTKGPKAFSLKEKKNIKRNVATRGRDDAAKFIS